MSKNQSTTAHSRAIQALTDARQNTRQYRFYLERADNIQDDAIFIQNDSDQDPHKLAHAALIDFYEEVNQPEYTIKVENLWQENLKDRAGHDIKIDVPKERVIEKTVTDQTGINNFVPDRSDIETKAETVSLETLGHRWSNRTIKVRVTVDSPYYAAENRTETVKLWLPPKAIREAYSQLNSALSKIGLLAQTSAPIEHDPEPI